MSEDQRLARMTDRLSQKLSLTPDQKEKVGAIVRSHRDRIKALTSQVQPQFEEEKKLFASDINKVLTPEQQEKFAKLRAKMEEHWKKKPFLF